MLQRMLDGCFNGYNLPAVPRACRSPRGKMAMRKKTEKTQIQEFETLAKVAEKFLEEQGTDDLETESEPENNLLDGMDMDIDMDEEGTASMVIPESKFSISLSKDWLALGPSRENQMRRSCSEDGSQQSDRVYPFKKRKFYQQYESSLGEDTFKSREKKTNASRKSSSIYQQANSEKRTCDVKFSIQCVKVPELFIDIPVSATIRSLKTTVMEAVSAILKDGLHVGILRQGKKVRDDSKTLAQTGISKNNEHKSLGFTLEPGHPQITRRASQPPNRPTASNEEALSVVPLRPKSGPSGTAQRRIRRPFTVSEVETLVQAVEKLGTRRWRDVKSYAFDDAGHRTYVDLKDKWKTLVHTARILPWQRRGEPVPQELLDRVLAAHAFWSERTSGREQTRCPKRRVRHLIQEP